jgi:hypothetical protein
MTIVSTKEFNANQEKYFDMAVNEEVCIKRGDSMFHLMYESFETEYPEQPILEPDENLRNGITAEELLERIHKDIHRKFASRV